MTARSIASVVASLTPAQKKALLWLPADGNWVIAPPEMEEGMPGLVRAGLARWPASAPEVHITPLGLTVRAAVAKEAECG